MSKGSGSEINNSQFSEFQPVNTSMVTNNNSMGNSIGESEPSNPMKNNKSYNMQ